MFLQTPAQCFTRAQRNNGQLAKRQAGRGGPLVTHQRDGVLIGGQAVERRTVKAGEALQLVQCVTLLESFCVQLDGRIGGVATGATAGVFLGVLGVRCRVGAQKELAAAAVAASSRET